jgi:hypothetical protein
MPLALALTNARLIDPASGAEASNLITAYSDVIPGGALRAGKGIQTYLAMDSLPLRSFAASAGNDTVRI